MVDQELSPPAETPLQDRLTQALRHSWRLALSSPWTPAWIYLLNLTIAELLTTLIAPRAGMIAHAVIFVLLLLHATLGSHGAQSKFLLTLSLAPLIRVLSLALPLTEFPVSYWYVVVGAPLFLATYLTARQAHLTRRMVGLQITYLPWQIVIGLFGVLLGLVEYLILRPSPLASALRWELLLFPALSLLIFTGFLEELIFRGVLQSTAGTHLGRWGLFYVAGIFAVLHLGYRSVLDVLFVFGVAILFGLLVPRPGGSLLGVTLAHGLTNISLYLVFPFLLAPPAAPIVAPPDILAPAAAVTPAAGRLLPTALLPELVLPATASPTPTPSPTPAFSATPAPNWALTSVAEILTGTARAASPTPTVTQTPCPIPSSWVPYVISPGDSLSSLGYRFQIDPLSLVRLNCLPEPVTFTLGQVIYVPKVSPPVETRPPKPTTRPSATPPDTPPPTDRPRPSPTEPPIPTSIPAPTEPPPTEPPPPTPEPTQPLPTPAPTEG